MKNYQFLLKPVFYICSLLFATWLILEIEKVSPSDFQSNNVQKPSGDTSKTPIDFKPRYYFLKKLSLDYKIGVIDSLEFDHQLILFLKSQ